jgi:hypothetical protein
MAWHWGVSPSLLSLLWTELHRGGRLWDCLIGSLAQSYKSERRLRNSGMDQPALKEVHSLDAGQD